VGERRRRGGRKAAAAVEAARRWAAAMGKETKEPREAAAAAGVTEGITRRGSGSVSLLLPPAPLEYESSRELGHGRVQTCTVLMVFYVWFVI
jgi:hypothetical protein